MIFIAKPGKDPSTAKNYRPITLLDIIGKAFGKLVNRRFVSHLETKGKVNPLQYGFRKGRGTESSLALIYEYVSRKMSAGYNHKVSVVSRDISGAFDRVWHEKLMVLFSENLDLPPLFAKLLSNFLTNRQNNIKIEDYVGPSFTPEAGVPQGAPDSPDIFNVTTLPLNDAIYTPNCYAPWYCDDLHLVVATPCHRKRIELHKAKTEEAIKNQDYFERSRGIITCAEKSIITDVAHYTQGYIEYDQGDNRIRYNYLPANESTKILGLHINKYS